VAVYQSLLEWLTASTLFSYFSKTFRRLSRKFIIPRSPARVFLVVILFVLVVRFFSLECCEDKFISPAFSEDAPHHSQTPIISFANVRALSMIQTFFVQESQSIITK
jgi:hypothetical protein